MSSRQCCWSASATVANRKAAGVMRNANILAYDRSRSKMGALRTAGEVPGKIEFPN